MPCSEPDPRPRQMSAYVPGAETVDGDLRRRCGQPSICRCLRRHAVAPNHHALGILSVRQHLFDFAKWSIVNGSIAGIIGVRSYSRILIVQRLGCLIAHALDAFRPWTSAEGQTHQRFLSYRGIGRRFGIGMGPTIGSSSLRADASASGNRFRISLAARSNSSAVRC
jgi:hypothetical protein